MSSLQPDYFDALYKGNPDPWGFASSDYEAGKYAATLAALPRAHYAAALEIGCSIGILTAALAPRCDHIFAVDVAEAALEQARDRNCDNVQVTFERRQFPGDMPYGDGAFDLILLSEVLYYLDAETLVAAAARVTALAAPGADILMVHWLGPTPDYPLTGEQAAEGFIAALPPTVTLVDQWRQPEYRIDLLRG